MSLISTWSPSAVTVVRISSHRVGVPLVGVGFPGHFLARLDGSAPLVLDAFHGRILDAAACSELLRVVAGPGASLVPELHLRPAAPREILVRMLTNLKQLYARARDFGRTLGCCERILLLSPDASHELRDRLRTLRARRMH